MNFKWWMNAGTACGSDEDEESFADGDEDWLGGSSADGRK